MTRSRILGAMVRGKTNILLLGILFPLVRSTSVNGLKSHHFQFVKLYTTQRHEQTEEEETYVVTKKHTHTYIYSTTYNNIPTELQLISVNIFNLKHFTCTPSQNLSKFSNCFVTHVTPTCCTPKRTANGRWLRSAHGRFENS